MKKTLSILLAIFMIASTIVVLSIPSTMAETTGTAISTPVEFAAMSADGIYYLANDLTIDATYTAAFTGTLDGDSKTITTSVPLFDTVSGTVKNLTVAGTVDYSTIADDAGAIAKVANGATFTAVTNKATVNGYTTTYLDGEAKTLATAGGVVGLAKGSCTFDTVSNQGAINGYCAGGIVGIVGFSWTDSTSFTNCSNSGAITATGVVIDGTTTSATYYPLFGGNNLGTGGIVGLIYEMGSVTFTGCTNSGNIDNSTITTTTGNPYAPAGGIYGIATYDLLATLPSTMTVTLADCSNTASIKGIRQTGGLIGWAGYADLNVSNCNNSGAIESTTSYAGGIMGRGSETNINVTNCVNETTGTVTAFVSQMGGIAGYMENAVIANIDNCKNMADLTAVNASTIVGGIIAKTGAITTFTITNCSNFGDITSTNAAAGILGYTSADVTITGSVNNGNIIGANQTGGIGGYLKGATTVNYCTNNGFIHDDGGTGNYSGGIVCRIDGAANFTGCINNGDVISGKDNSGGMVAYLPNCGTFISCFNYGDVTAIKAAGGIVGSMGTSTDYNAPYIAIGCGNEGTLTSMTTYAAGIFAYCWGSDSANKIPTIKYCYSIGDVTASAQACGLLGYVNGVVDPEIAYNYISGTLTSITGSTYATIYNNHDDVDSECLATHDNYCQVGVADYLRYYHGVVAQIDDPDSDDVTKTIEGPDVSADDLIGDVKLGTDYAYYYEEADLASGKLAYTINTAIGSDLFYQTIGVDTHPTSYNPHQVVYLDGADYSNTEPETTVVDTTVAATTVAATTVASTTVASTTVAADTTVANTTATAATTTTDDDGGCNCGDSDVATIIIGFVTIITSFGLFIVIKKK